MKILLVDDTTMLREALAGILEQQPDISAIGQASFGREAVAVFRKFRPDITLMDLHLKDPDGMEGEDVIRAILREFPEARIIVLSRYFGIQRVAWAIEAGAQSFVPAGMGIEDLLSVVRAVHGGEPLIPPQLLARIAAVPKQDWLTRREFQMLLLLERGHSREAIASILDIAVPTVAMHIQGMYRKLKVDNPLDAIKAGLEGNEPLPPKSETAYAKTPRDRGKAGGGDATSVIRTLRKLGRWKTKAK